MKIKPGLILLLTVFTIFSCKKSETIKASTTPKDTISIKKPDTTKNIIPVKNYLIYIGTYTPGIYIYSMSPITGELKKLGVSPNTSNPSFLAIHPNKKWIFSVNENSNGTVSAFRIKDSITLESINSVPSKGDAPCYVSIDISGKYLLTANYNSGSVASFPIKSDGSLGTFVSNDQHIGSSVNINRQTSPHAHSIIPFFNNNLIFSADLGTDKIYCYQLDTTSGVLSKVGNTSINPGSGPRHIAFHPNKRWMYEVNEMGGTIEQFSIDSITGSLNYVLTFSIVQTVGDAAAGADIHISPSGKFLYASNRDPENVIALFSIDQQTGNLNSLGFQSSMGKTPRNFAIDPTGNFLLVANQNSNNIVIFRIDQSGGLLTQIGTTTVSSPVCIKFMNP